MRGRTAPKNCLLRYSARVATRILFPCQSRRQRFHQRPHDPTEEVDADRRADEEEAHQDQDTVPFRLGDRPGQLLGQQTDPDAKAVQRRQRQEVEDGQDAVQQHTGAKKEAEIVVEPPGVDGKRIDQERVVPRGDAQPDRQGQQRRYRQVRDRPGRRDDGHARARPVAQRVHVHRNRLAPAEAGEKQQQRPERVQVHQRVERDAAQPPGRIIAQIAGAQRVAELMKGDAQQQRDGHRAGEGEKEEEIDFEKVDVVSEQATTLSGSGGWPSISQRPASNFDIRGSSLEV